MATPDAASRPETPNSAPLTAGTMAPAPTGRGPRPVPGLTERPAHSVPGITFLIVGILLIVAAGLGLRGLTPVAPGQARVVQLFGQYDGTIREPGLRWVNPFTDRIKVSTRIRNHETTVAKVNDFDGNPIEIAAVVW